jgi:hypothetical protein
MDHYECNIMRIDDYFTNLKARIDLLVEIYIQENHHNHPLVELINKSREECINEINECEAEDLDELEKNEKRHIFLDDEVLFKRFCFIFQFLGDVLTTGRFTWHFISTDMFLRPGQVECFQELVKFIPSIDAGHEYTFKSQAESLKMLFATSEKIKPVSL